MDKPYLRSQEAAKFLSVDMDTFRTFYRSGKLQSFRPNGKLLYFKQEDLIKFIESGKM